MSNKGLKRQGSLYVLAALVIVVTAIPVVPRLWSQTSQACTQYTRVFIENFDTLVHKDGANCSVAGWSDDTQWNARGPITLRRLGANFAVTSPGSMGARIYAPAAADFSGDGYPDLIGLDITGQETGGTPLSRLVLVRNRYQLDAVHPFLVDETEVYETFDTHTGPCAITAGDFNGDGLIDFFFMRDSTDDFVYDNFMAALYINTGTATEPQFVPHDLSPNLDFTATFQGVPVYVNWLADHLTSADIDRDGDLDILVISQDNVFLVRNPGAADFALANFSITTLADDTGFTIGRGGSCISAADLDNDGDIDFAAGTVNDIPYLVIYKNDGLGHFTREELAIPNDSCTGSVGIQARDFTNDGWVDIFVVTDRWNAGNLAHMWMMRNVMSEDMYDNSVDPPVKIDWEFKCFNNCEPIIPPLYDVDASTALDYDADGDLDLVISDANHTDDYYLIKNELAEVYALYGQAQSLNVGAGYVDPRLHAVTQVRIRSIVQGVRGGSSNGLGVAIYFSNNGGRDWEFYQRFEGAGIVTTTGLDWHIFNQFGADLRWRAVLTAEDDLIPDFPHASYETPFIGEIDLEYIYVDRREYSRASAAATVISPEGTPKKLVIGSSFIYPGWEGQLRAYDVSGVSFAAGTTSALQTITTSDLDAAMGRTLVEGAEIFWDAGQMLDDRDPDSRRIYTAIRAAGNLASPLVKTEFSRANVATLTPFLQDVNNDNEGLIDFVRGENRYWKLGDINHSTPAIIGPPAEDPDLMGAGYAEFKAAYADRAKVLYIGANDGMLHCFDTVTGEELWGFIPYNLLPKLKNMYAVDVGNNARFYAHDVYVDGSPAVADVQINGAWRTVLVCGQGPGKGSTLAGGLNYYWALDVTDPNNPIPLWEITHKDSRGRITMGETWSTPTIGKINHSGTARWVAFMGSGYDNDPANDLAGRSFYVVQIDKGALLDSQLIIRTVQVSDVDTSSLSGARQPYRYTNIMPAIVASPTAVDNDLDSYVNSVYVADLDGRLYRMDMTASNPSNWSLAAIYTDYLYYPIVTKPAVWINPYESVPTPPHIYFGTGGHDRGLGTYNPNTDELAAREFSFIGIIDTGGNSATVEWYIGNPAYFPNESTTKDTGDLGVGSKVWADPVIADQVVYFSTLIGSIESVDPCINLGEGGRLYARYIRQTSAIPVGGTAFRTTEATPPEYLQLISKARQAVTVGEASRVAGRISKREIYVQEYDSTIEQLAQPIGSLLRIKSWREVYKIIR